MADFFILMKKKNGRLKKEIIIRFLKDGNLREKKFPAYSTHHGPVMGKRNGQWISVRSYNRSLNSLEQSWLRTKAKGLEDYKKVMDMKGNTSIIQSLQTVKEILPTGMEIIFP